MTADDAKREAWDAARQKGGPMAAVLLDQTQFSVLRQIVSRLLPDGEAGFWLLVKEEIER